MTPSMGRIVMVNADPDENNGADQAPAVITRVWSDTLVNVRVFLDADTTPEWRTSVKLHDARPETVGHDAWWPPRV